MDIIWGRRPGIEAKYDALLLKLDRSYSQLKDSRDYWEKLRKESPLAATRRWAKAQVKGLNRMLHDLAWMKGHNQDLIVAAQEAGTAKEAET